MRTLIWIVLMIDEIARVGELLDVTVQGGTTPVEPGLVEIRARVTLTAAMR